MHPVSEYNTKPRLVLVHSPDNNVSLLRLTQPDTAQHNFSAIPDHQGLLDEFHGVIRAIQNHGIQVIDVASLLNDARVKILDENPNSIFVRDSIVTLPWQPQLAIVANMRLAGRQGEPQLLRAALEKLGVTRFIEPPADMYLEGGDIIAATQAGRRTLFIGIGSRTTLEAAKWLARTLIPQGYANQLVCIQHNRTMLHLDTCFTILPRKTVLYAEQSLVSGVVIGDNLQPVPIEPIRYLKAEGYTLLPLTQTEATQEEDCNVLFVGAQHFLSFKLPPTLASRVEQTAGIKLQELNGAEISKANGGIHCLTRPIYL